MATAVTNRSIPGVSWKAGLVAAGILGTLALFLLAWAYPTFPGDEGALTRFQSLRAGWLDDTAVAFAIFGKAQVFLPAMVALAGGLMLARRYVDLAMFVAGLMVFGVGSGLKELVGRPRPEFLTIGPDASGLSFPSGHALLAVVVGGVLVHLIGHSVKPLLLRRAIQGGIILAVIVMGASRVYLGAHWPSDVIGSFVFGVMAMVGVIGFRNTVASSR